ncbi:MAG TPA: cytochrome c3 family protein, partial [Saprospiraceae bacterium]|nr:cytochrome c3 family protein [Saprospiraceae bacterium]
HIGGNYANTPNTCAGCHTNDFNQASNPNHVALGLSTDCASCHTTQPDWYPATFANHNDYYVLEGAHAAIANDCAACHGGDYNNTPNTCVGCHQQEYNSTTNPNHLAAQFSTNCVSCHSQNSWVPSFFDHNDFYPLLGAHAAIANNCTACHIGGNYNNTPNTCFGCHQQEYNSANDPNHLSAGFPTDCQTCHSVNAWTPSTFNHDGMYFPIYSGKHDGEWNSCTDCHLTPGNFSAFSCIDCHEHNNPAELANDHEDVNGYIYQSSACFACHPDGED